MKGAKYMDYGQRILIGYAQPLHDRAHRIR